LSPDNGILRLLLVGIVPFLSDLFLPVGCLGQLIDSVLNDSEGLAHFVVFHVFLVIKFISEFKQVIDLSLLCIFHLPCSLSPSRLLRASFFALFASNRRSFAGIFD